MIRLTEQYQSPAVVQWSLRLPWLPDYLEWVQSHYLARQVWDNDHIIYFVPRWPADQPLPNTREAHLGNSLMLRGYQLEEGTTVAGSQLNLKVYWQTNAPLSKNYTIFTQLIDNEGKLAVGWDSQPLGGYFSTRQWPINEIVTDVVQMPIPPDLPPGDYTLITGMYVLETLERLQTPEAADYIMLTTVHIE